MEAHHAVDTQAAGNGGGRGGPAAALAVGSVGVLLAWRESYRRERQADAFVHLQAAAVLIGANPSVAGRWSDVVSNLTAARGLDDQEYFTDRVIACLEGPDARVAQDRPVDRGQRVLFGGDGDGLFVSAAGGSTFWRVGTSGAPSFRPSSLPEGQVVGPSGWHHGPGGPCCFRSTARLGSPCGAGNLPTAAGGTHIHNQPRLLHVAGTRDGKRLAGVLRTGITHETLASWDLPSGRSILDPLAIRLIGVCTCRGWRASPSRMRPGRPASGI